MISRKSSILAVDQSAHFLSGRGIPGGRGETFFLYTVNDAIGDVSISAILLQFVKV